MGIMNFKQYLQERASYYREDCNLLEYGFIPLTPKISKLLGGGKNTQVFHVTSLDFLPGLKKIGKSKGISTFTKHLGSVIQNINVKPEVMVKLEGNIVFKSDKDAFTHLDKSGLRWINIRTLAKDVKEYNFIWDALSGKTIRYMNEKYNLNIEDEDLKEKFICDYWGQLKAKEKKDVKDFYIAHAEQIFQNKMYLDILKNILNDSKIKYKHDEIVLNKFKVLGVYSIEAGRFQYDHSMAQYYIEKMGYKYLGHIEKTEFSKVTPETY